MIYTLDHEFWTLCGTGPMQDEYHVKRHGKVLFAFKARSGGPDHVRAYSNACSLRGWLVAWEYKRLAAQRRAAEGVKV